MCVIVGVEVVKGVVKGMTFPLDKLPWLSGY